VVLCIAGVALGKVQTTARNAGRVDPIGRVIGTTVNPVATVLAVGLNGTSDFFSGVVNAHRLTVENRSLRDLQTMSAMYIENVERLQREIDALRRLQDLPAIAGKEKIPADVISLYAYENRVTISVGANKGLRPGMPVTTADGLLGIVQVVDAGTSQVLLLSGLNDLNQRTRRIGAVARRNPPPAGLLKGEGFSLLTLEFQDPKAPVEIGDEVYTAGFSDMIPSGIKIGRIIQVSDDPNSGMRRASVFPSVAMGRVHEVVVLK
jgi:rod shape-determining protein MreC